MTFPFNFHSRRARTLAARAMLAASALGASCAATAQTAPAAQTPDADAPAPSLDAVSVTATREERPTGEVPQAISVVGAETLDNKKMFNLKEALQEMPGVLIDSGHGAYDARLIIRGAGLLAPYGIREIMVLRDGVPLSDPDSMTRLDLFNTQDVERIEVAKGPGNLFAAGSAGGAIQIISKSVFDQRSNTVRAGFGTDGARTAHMRYGSMVGDNQALAVTLSRRQADNNWRRRSAFDATHLSLKHGLDMGSSGTLESEMAYSQSNAKLPGDVDDALYARFRQTGRQQDTSAAWKNSGRYSKVLFFNSRLERTIGDLTLKPRVYYNTWSARHPISGMINNTEKWISNLGADLEANWRHGQGTLVAGLTARHERAPDSRKYEYADIVTSGSGRVQATLSDRLGNLAEKDNETTLLTGAYIQESWRPGERWIIDLGMRYDIVKYDDTNIQSRKYDYSSGTYIDGAGLTKTRKTFRLPAPKLAISYKLADGLHLFGMVARAGQIPSFSELTKNHDLDAPTSTNYEVGLKGRSHNWSFDASIYYNPVKKEIVQQNNGGVTDYLNAGKTSKKGFEFSGRYAITPSWETGGYFSYSNYRYKEFSEPVRVGNATVNMNRNGNALPYVPRQQYGLFVAWRHDGWRVRASTNTWGKYWMDSANTQRYGGWAWVTNLSVGYQWDKHSSLMLNIDNLFDKRYAMEATRDTSGKNTYTLAMPRSVLLMYRYDF